MYYSYFGLQEEPFSIAVNPKYLFMSARHRDALAHLLYGVGAGGGFILLTGEVGTGKTTINRCLLQQLPSETDIAIILNPALDADELLASACDELGIEYARGSSTLKDLTDKLHAFLLENHSRGRNTVLLIDEAQHLQFDVLEQIRLLTNLETNTRKLLQIILVGQPELGVILSKPELRQLSQRVTARYNLQPLDLDETDAYIRHRLQVAGLPANQELFPASVVKGIYKRTRGIPRLINVLCDRMLLGTYGQNKTRVDAKMLNQAAAEVLGEASPTGTNKLSWGLTAAAVLLVALVWWWQTQVPSAELPALEVATPLSSTPLSATPAPNVAAQVSQQVEPAALTPWVRQEQLARQALADYLGLPIDGSSDTCAVAGASGWRCESLVAQSWDEVIEIDRPAVLSLLTPSRFAASAVLVGIDGDMGRLLYEGQEIEMPLAQLGLLWRGEYLIMWRPPASYSGPFGRGESGSIVAWLAQEFADLDGQSQALTGEVFNEALDTRVRMFQRDSNLRDDGVVGLKTLLRLNMAVGRETAKLSASGAGISSASVSAAFRVQP
jgi:general secretion pathway protein A